MGIYIVSIFTIVYRCKNGYAQRPGGLISCRQRRGAAFFASPGRWQVAKGHGEAAKRYQVQIDGSEVSCHDEIVSVKSKKQGARASARQPMMLSREMKLSGCTEVNR